MENITGFLIDRHGLIETADDDLDVAAAEINEHGLQLDPTFRLQLAQTRALIAIADALSGIEHQLSGLTPKDW